MNSYAYRAYSVGETPPSRISSLFVSRWMRTSLFVFFLCVPALNASISVTARRCQAWRDGRGRFSVLGVGRWSWGTVKNAYARFNMPMSMLRSRICWPAGRAVELELAMVDGRLRLYCTRSRSRRIRKALSGFLPVDGVPIACARRCSPGRLSLLIQSCRGCWRSAVVTRILGELGALIQLEVIDGRSSEHFVLVRPEGRSIGSCSVLILSREKR